jgi:hypothetical protein
MEKLIEAALVHARQLRNGADAADDHGARPRSRKLKRWEKLARAAQDELTGRGNAVTSNPLETALVAVVLFPSAEVTDVALVA